MSIPKWSPKPPQWSKKTSKLLMDGNIAELPTMTLSSFIEKSDEFPIKFPVDTGRCKTLKNKVSEEILERNINSVYPLIHENALELCCKFILFKTQHGSEVEKKLYKEMNAKDFIDRLLTKRAVMFMGKFDSYLLLNGKKGSKNWETIGTDKEKSPLVLKDCLSYDEIKLSAFLSASSYTYFQNVGDRKNMAKITEDRKDIADEGIIAGMIGPRLVKQNVMEYQEIVISSSQNTEENGYGENTSNTLHKLFADFYQEPCFTYKEAIDMKNSSSQAEKRFTSIKDDGLFDNYSYYKRLAITIDTLLLEANSRAQAKKTTAYIHVVGLGLGVWKASSHQLKVYMDSFAERISTLGKTLNAISDICFSYINQPKCGTVKNGELFPIEGHPSRGIKIYIFKREPHKKLLGRDAGKLLVVSYAWDGNALPGNEYWSGKLGSSGDSAAASSTQITEIHNPHINPLVKADNLRIVTSKGVVSFEEYRVMARCDKSKRKRE